MLPHLHRLFLALTMALILVAGTVGIYSAQAATFRSTIHDAEAYDSAMAVTAYDTGSDDTLMISAPGMPY